MLIAITLMWVLATTFSARVNHVNISNEQEAFVFVLKTFILNHCMLTCEVERFKQIFLDCNCNEFF